MTNAELLAPLQEAFPDLWSGYWPEYPNTKYTDGYIIKVLIDFIALIGEPELHGMEPSILSIRQICLATMVYELCHRKNIGDALHQLMDCIDNCGERTRQITPIEHLVYYGLAQTILIAVQGLV